MNEVDDLVVKDKNADEVLNKYARRSDNWIKLLETKNKGSSEMLESIIDKIPTYGPLKSEKRELDIAVMYSYFKAYNLIQTINRSYEKKNSKSITARFILLRAIYEVMCSVQYLTAFPEKARQFIRSDRQNIKELHKGFLKDEEAENMYNTVYGFLCGSAHPSIKAARTNRIIRIYLIKGKKVSLEDIHEKVRLIFLELFFNYYYMMVQHNLISIFLTDRWAKVPLLVNIMTNYETELFPKDTIEKMQKWQKEFSILSKFIDEVQEVTKNYRNKAIEVKDVDDLNSRIESIYELREHKTMIEHYKKIVNEKYGN